MMRFVVPAVLLWGVVWLVGAGRREAARPLYRRATSVVGLAAMFAAVGALWRWRRHVFTGAAVTVLAVFATTVVVAWVWWPAERAGITFAAVVCAIAGVAVWDWETTGGRPWRDVISERRRADEIRAAVAATNPDARPGRVVIDGQRATIEVEHVGEIDPVRVGQALHVPHTSSSPADVMGRTTVELHDETPSPELSVWAAIRARGPRRWPGELNPTGTIRFGEDAAGNVHMLPALVDPSTPSNVLMAGMTGAGKSNGLALVLCEAAAQPDVAWIGLDPHRVELKPFAPRMSRIAKGPEQCYQMLDWLVAEMDRRFAYLDANDIGEWRIGVDGPGILWVADELGALAPRSSWPQLKRLTAEQRKIGFGCIGATQRSSSKVIELDTRDNFQIRIAFGMNSREGTVMVLDHDEDKTFRPTDIPEDLQGAYVLRLRRQRLAGRCFIPAFGGLDKAAVQSTVAAVAEATSHLKVDLLAGVRS